MRARLIYLAIFAAAATIAILYATIISDHSLARSLYSQALRPTPQPQTEEIHIPDESSPEKEAQWSFDYKRDARNYGLSAAQCDAAFPLLYHEVERAVKHRKANKIRLEEMETEWRGDGIVRAMIWDNQLYIIEARGVWDGNHRPRAVANLHAIHRAIIAHQGPLPNIEFTLTHHDAANLPGDDRVTWAYSRPTENQELWLMPDFNLWAWPDVNIRSYGEFRHLVDHNDLEFIDKKPQLVWRGSVAVGSKDVRGSLLAKSQGKPWSDVNTLDWSNQTNIQENLITMDNHCQYMFVAQTEGNTYSGRLKFLLGCGSVVVAHKMKFLEHFHHLMQPDGPNQNFVQVKRDFTDLEGKIEGMLGGQAGLEKARKVAQEARKTFTERYLTPAAEGCYWRNLFRGWSEVQGFQVKFWEDVDVKGKDGKTKKVRRPRGVPFESYVVMEATEWEVPTKARKICEY